MDVENNKVVLYMNLGHRKLYFTRNKVILELRNVKLVLRNPQIQPFGEKMKDKNDILHFYYDFEIYKKEYGKNKWNCIVKRYITEFGVIEYLEQWIDGILNTDMNKDSIKYYLNWQNEDIDEDEYEIVKPFKLRGILNEDVFCITRHFKTFTDIRGKNEFEFYDLSVMLSNGEIDRTMVGIGLTDLTRKDIKILKRFGKIFMKKAIEKELYLEKKYNGK